MSSSKAKGVSATSFFDLKAELSKKETEFAKAKAEGRNLAVIGGVKRPDKVSIYNFRPFHKTQNASRFLKETHSMGTTEQRHKGTAKSGHPTRRDQ